MNHTPRTHKFLTLPAAAVVAALTLIWFAAPHASAQNIASPTVQVMSTPPGTFVIRNARIVTVSGPVIENGTLVISDGRIASVGANAAAPAGAIEVDARGLSVYPGMIDAETNMGLNEIGAVGATVDVQELGDMNPNIAAIWGINPHSANVDVTRVAGVTSVVTMPQGGIIAGQAALINLNGTTPREMSVVPSAALVIEFPRIGGGGGFAAFLAAQ
ncbi:MAG: hypothetical protein WCD76_04175, partial [Pyrinomonadaceae bacterium]